MGGQDIQWSHDTKYLGITLNSKLNWSEHINNKIKKCKQLLMAFKSAIGRRWGPRPSLMKWAYTGMVRPILLYGAHIWGKDLTKQQTTNMAKLNRLACLLMAPVWKSTPTAGMEIIYNIPPLDLEVEKRAKNNYIRIISSIPTIWDRKGTGKQVGHLLYWERLCSITLHKQPDQIPLHRSWDKKFSTSTIPSKNGDHEPCCYDIVCYTDGSKMDKNAGLGYIITFKRKKRKIERYNQLREENTVFQAEVAAIMECAKRLLLVKNKHILIRSDSKSAIQAIAGQVTKSKLVLECKNALNSLTNNKNRIDLRWIKAHVGFVGNERADELAKLGTTADGRKINIPIPPSWYKQQTDAELISRWTSRWKTEMPCRQTKLWCGGPRGHIIKRKDLLKLNRNNLGMMVQVITGHNSLQRHLGLCYSDEEPTCRQCCEEEETSWHLIAECPAWSRTRNDILGNFSLGSPPKSTSKVLRFLRETSMDTLLGFTQVF